MSRNHNSVMVSLRAFSVSMAETIDAVSFPLADEQNISFSISSESNEKKAKLTLDQPTLTSTRPYSFYTPA